MVPPWGVTECGVGIADDADSTPEPPGGNAPGVTMRRARNRGATPSVERLSGPDQPPAQVTSTIGGVLVISLFNWSLALVAGGIMLWVDVHRRGPALLERARHPAGRPPDGRGADGGDPVARPEPLADGGRDHPAARACSCTS